MRAGHQDTKSTERQCSVWTANGQRKGTRDRNTARAGAKIWLDNADSLGRMWGHVGKETGTAWRTWAELFDVDRRWNQDFKS